MTTVDGDEDWEVCNDDGFVYKRKKRQRFAGTEEETGAGETSKRVDPELDPAAEERNRRERKKRTLLKLKTKYQREIQQWEILSNSLNAMQEKADRFQSPPQDERRNANETASSFLESSSTEGAGEHGRQDASSPPSLLDQLLFMAEAQEAIINDVSNLCEVAENICRMEEEEEEEKQQSLFDLDIWNSPRDLMASLGAD